ncbi:hypothetical protein I79_026136 [Cricetulus griseus]|uniref:Uncharacterized protein n=1 Tax=Cricetulus griseus TaxID=10029 RepID=G3IQ46_CRIGR|nr:hypothetical protein I79_026136 [Cricetulus griseus]
MYIAAITDQELIHGRATQEGNIVCIVNILWSSAFASIRVASGPGAPYRFAKAILGVQHFISLCAVL